MKPTTSSAPLPKAAVKRDMSASSQPATAIRFFDGIPGVTVTEEVLAVKPMRVHSWNMTGAWKLTTLDPDGAGASPFPKPPEQKAFSPRMKAMKKYLLAGDAEGITA